MEKTTEEQRQAYKMFQNFFTKILYKQTTDFDGIASKINNLCKTHSHEVWKKLMSFYYGDDIDEKKFYDGWNNKMRFYLKGGKATLESIERIIDTFKEQDKVKITIPEELSLIDITQPQYQKSGIFKAFYHEFSKSTEDSDFDFCFLLHPSLIQTKQHEADRKLSKLINEHAKIMNDEFLRDNLASNYIKYVNKNILTLYNTIQSFSEEQLLYFTDEQVAFFNFLNDTNYKQKLLFDYENKEQIVQFTAKKVQIDIDVFYLYRIFIKLKFVDDESNKIFSNLSSKLFAECIDISFSVKPDVANMLWSKSSLDVILKPLYPLYLMEHPIKTIAFMYPVVSTSYQINDILVVLSEADPNKPQKRCKRFLEQLYFACAEEQLPSLPSKVTIGKSIYKLMQQEENECNELNSILTLSSQTEDTFTFEVKIKYLDQFEQWCKKSTYNKINLSWSSQCTFISKDKLITYVQNLITNLYDYDPSITLPSYYYSLPYELRKYTSAYLCEFYKQLLLLDVCIILLLIDGDFHKFTNDQIEKWNTLQSYFNVERNNDGDMFVNNSSNITYTLNQQTLGINFIKTLKLKLSSDNVIKSNIIAIVLKNLDNFMTITPSSNEYYYISIIGNVKKGIKEALSSGIEGKSVYASFLHLLSSFTLR